MQVEARVGTQTLSAGNLASPSLGKLGHSLSADLLPRYYEAVANGMVFCGGTAATGVAPGTSIGTTAAFTLYNPSGSGKKLVVAKVSMSYISGTLGAGTVHYVANVNPSAAAVSGTAITVIKTDLSVASTTAQGNVGLAFTTATLPTTPTVLRPFCSLTALLASTAVAPYTVTDDVAGEFVISPGCALSLEGTTAAGSSPLVVFGATWVEVPA